MLQRIRAQINFFLAQPKRFLLICVGVCFFTLVLDGSLWRLYSLHKQYGILETRKQKSIADTEEYRLLIKKARQPEFLKKQARERFDWIEEDELVFLFTKRAKTRATK